MRPRGYDAQRDREGHGFRARSRFEFALRIFEIFMRSRLRDAELDADCPVGTAVSDQPQALDFPFRQTGGRDRKTMR